MTTDGNGFATIALPTYFESINKNFRYQLTVVDENATDFVMAMVVRKISGNQFTIRTSQPNVGVSWRVEATRNDKWVQTYGFKTEQEKEGALKGKYINPEFYGKAREQGINFRPRTEETAQKKR